MHEVPVMASPEGYPALLDAPLPADHHATVDQVDDQLDAAIWAGTWARWVDRAMSWLTQPASIGAGKRNRYIDTLRALPPVASENDYDRNLDMVRGHAYDESKLSTGENCVEGTNGFLDAMGIELLPEPEPEPEPEPLQKLVTVQVEITFYVDNTADVYDTKNDVEKWLRIDLAEESNVDDMDEGSFDYVFESVNVEFDE